VCQFLKEPLNLYSRACEFPLPQLRYHLPRTRWRTGVRFCSPACGGAVPKGLRGDLSDRPKLACTIPPSPGHGKVRLDPAQSWSWGMGLCGNALGGTQRLQRGRTRMPPGALMWKGTAQIGSAMLPHARRSSNSPGRSVSGPYRLTLQKVRHTPVQPLCPGLPELTRGNKPAGALVCMEEWGAQHELRKRSSSNLGLSFWSAFATCFFQTQSAPCGALMVDPLP